MDIKPIFIQLLAAVSILIAGCHSHFANKSVAVNRICKFQLEYTIPDIMDDGRPFVLKQKAEAIEDDKYSLYRLPYVYTLRKDDVLLKDETRYRVLVYRKGEDFGDFYRDDSTGNVSERVNVDSLLKQTVFNRVDIYNPDFFRLSQINTNAEEITQVFTYAKKVSNSDCDSVLLYYNRQNVGISYSLSKTLDTNNQYKLYKVDVICPGYYSEKYRLTVPGRIISLELKKNNDIKPADEIYFLGYIRRLNSGNK